MDIVAEGSKDKMPTADSDAGLTRAILHDVQNRAEQMTPKLPQSIPTTPAGKLALIDLIGSLDKENIEQNYSPDERVMWDHDPNNIPSSASSIGTRQRQGTKRARSSSPISSPALASPDCSIPRGTSHPPRANQPLRTPQADPGFDLWDKYNDRSTKQRPPGASKAVFTHLMQSSSPQPQTAPRSDASLRWSASCGIQWPKRRKVGVGKEALQVNDVFTDFNHPGPSKLSMVSALAGKVRGALVQSLMAEAVEEEEEEDTEAQKKAGHMRRSSPAGTIESPLHRKPVDVQKHVGVPEFPHNGSDTLTTEEVDNDIHMHKVDDSSDYGEFEDDEFDESAFSHLDSWTPAKPRRTREVIATRSSPKPGVSNIDKPSLPTDDSNRVASKSYTTLLHEEEENFGDSDDEIFAADLEQAVALFDDQITGPEKMPQKVNTEFSRASPKQKHEVTPEDDLEDEFGDDLDDVDFEVAETAATQSRQEMSRSHPSVRRWPP